MEVEPSTWYSSRVTLPSHDLAHWRLTSQPCLCSNHHSTWAHCILVSYQKGIIQGHPGHRCPTRKALGLCSRIVFRAVISPDVSTQNVFRYYMSVKHIWGNYFWCFGVYVTQDYAKVVMPNRRNQGNFSTLHRLYLWAHCLIPVQWLISIDGFKHSNSSVSVFKGILSRFGCMIWRLNAIFDENVDITY